MTLECSLYGTVENLDGIATNAYGYKRYNRSIFIYKKDNLFKYLHKQNDKYILYSYSNVDRNKQRTCLIINVERFETKDSLEGFLLSRDFQLHEKVECEVVEFKMNGYTVEFTKKENDVCYLCKTYCYVEEALEGEEILKTTYEDLGIKLDFNTEIFAMHF